MEEGAQMNEITERCPFCGGNVLRVKPVWKTWHFVACNGCKAGGPVRKTAEEAVRAWNGRHAKASNYPMGEL
jgi:Lar family restriction alleviation protein